MVTLSHKIALNLTTQSDDDTSMILSKQNIAVGLIGLRCSRRKPSAANRK